MWESAFRWEGFRGNPLRIMGTPPCFPLKQRSRKKENKASNNNTRKFHLPLSSSLLRWSQWHLVATPTSDPWTQPLQPPFSFFLVCVLWGSTSSVRRRIELEFDVFLGKPGPPGTMQISVLSHLSTKSIKNAPSRDSLSGGGVGWALSQHAGDLLAHNKSGA